MTEAPQPAIKAYVEKLCESGHRGTGTPEEAAAAAWLREKFEALGLETTVQPFKTPPSLPFVVLSHLIIALTGAAFIGCCPTLALLLIAFATVSFVGEYTCRWHWLRPLLSRRESRNVIGRWRPERPKRTIVFSGHLDSANQGLIFHPRLARLTAEDKLGLGPLAPTILGLLLLLLVAIIVSFGGSGAFLTLLDWLGAIILVISAVLMAEWMLGPFVPGANDNASGVAAALVLAERYMAEKPDDTEFYFIGFGAEEPNLVGAKAFLDEYGHRFDPESTYFINFDGIAAHRVNVVTSEAVMIPQAYPDQELVVFARRQIRAEERFRHIGVTGIKGHTDVLPFALAGFKSLSLVAMDGWGIPINYHTVNDHPAAMTYEQADLALDFAQGLVQRIRQENG
ncbi:MAG: M28 family peptidase [Myxococcales bacterium]|nr:MAG: M28 family peptidase [Myxococcales bacterium]